MLLGTDVKGVISEICLLLASIRWRLDPTVAGGRVQELVSKGLKIVRECKARYGDEKAHSFAYAQVMDVMKGLEELERHLDTQTS